MNLNKNCKSSQKSFTRKRRCNLETISCISNVKMNVFDELYHPPHLDHLPTRLVSRAENEHGEPIVEITPECDGTLLLKFVRKSCNVPFNKTVEDFLLYARKEGYKKVELEDDAMFENGSCGNKDCRYRSLLYRAFQNENSIYVKLGFHPVVDIEMSKSQLYNYSIIDAKNMALYFRPDIQAKIRAIPSDFDGNRFGQWVTEQKCCVRREILNNLDSLRTKMDQLPALNERSIEFLKSFTFYYTAHRKLQMDV